MTRLYFQRILLGGTLILTLGACTHKPSKTMKSELPIAPPSPPTQQVVLLKEARSEAMNLRGELSSLKILMAKQMGELQSLRKQAQSVQHREKDQGHQLQDIRSQLLSSQAERDQLRRHNMELEGQLTSLPDTTQLISDIQSLTGSFQQIMSSMKNLASDMRLIKQEMHISTKNLKPQQTKLSSSHPTSRVSDERTPDSNGRIMILEGDTLWRLSQTYNVSVDQLKDWNDLSSDLIMTGLRLQVVDSQESDEDQQEHVKTSTDLLDTETNENMPDALAQKVPHSTTETQEDTPSEPTHILSIAPPQSDSQELP